MVQIKEFRIVMPLSLEEYQIAQMYMVMKMQQENTTNTEGVEILENRPFEDDVVGKGQHTSKVYRLQSKVPAWISTFAPADALIMQEEAWNAYPRCKSVIKCPYLTKFLLTIETIHKADNGHSENVHGLSEEQLAARQVEIIDIASAAKDYWSYIIGSSSIDLSKFKSRRTGRGPLLEGWQTEKLVICVRDFPLYFKMNSTRKVVKNHDSNTQNVAEYESLGDHYTLYLSNTELITSRCDPVMTAYKLVTVDVQYWGFSSRLEQALLTGERALFLESHRNCFSWIDEWFGMTFETIRELEQQSDSSLNAILGKLTLAASKEDSDSKRRCSLDTEESFGKRSQLNSEILDSSVSTPM